MGGVNGFAAYTPHIWTLSRAIRLQHQSIFLELLPEMLNRADP